MKPVTQPTVTAKKKTVPYCAVLRRCGNDYGWSRFEGSRCQEEQEDRFEDDFDADCPNLPRDGITFPIYEYCHGEYPDDPMESAHLTGGKDVCGDRYLEGQAVIGEIHRPV